ncbi:hypothetical protein BDV12DRAFT_201821 [Aspergillus spectabilis]
MQALRPQLTTQPYASNEIAHPFTATPPSKFGTLSLLPPELRLYIYEYALTNGTTALIRTCRSIHGEITHRLYADALDVHLSPSLKDPHMAVSLRRLHLSWSFNEEQCFNARGVLRNIPLQRYEATKINLYATDKGNLAQLALLWWKIKDLILILGNRRTLKGVKLELNLVPKNGCTWIQTLPNPLLTQQQPPFGSWTFDLFWIPFSKLHKTPNRIKPLSDGTTHPLDDLIEAIETFLSIELRTTMKGPEAKFLRNRQDLNMALDHVENGWVWRTEEEMRADLLEDAFWKLPARVRGLLVGGGFVKGEEEIL